MNLIKHFFQNDFDNNEGVLILNNDEKYVKNFGKQWRDYQYVQVDSKNNFQHSKNQLKDLFFGNLDLMKNKTVLEIGCGSGRFTEIILEYCKYCFSLDLSNAIYFNVCKGNKKLQLIKADFNEIQIKNNIDIIICRGVLQHTPNPSNSIKQLINLAGKNSLIIFDIYKYPVLGFFHPKYLYWRPLINKFYNYESFEKFLKRNIKKIIKIRRNFKRIFFNSDIIADFFFPIWDYKDKINLTDNQLIEWAILDTLDGIFAKYDKPLKNSKVIEILNNLPVKIIKKNNKNYFIVQKII